MYLIYTFNIQAYTSKVNVLSAFNVEFARALVVMRPRRALFTELKKLDFPAPTGPCRRIRRGLTSGLPGWKLVTVVKSFCPSSLEREFKRGWLGIL